MNLCWYSIFVGWLLYRFGFLRLCIFYFWIIDFDWGPYLFGLAESIL